MFLYGRVRPRPPVEVRAGRTRAYAWTGDIATMIFEVEKERKSQVDFYAEKALFFITIQPLKIRPKKVEKFFKNFSWLVESTLLFFQFTEKRAASTSRRSSPYKQEVDQLQGVLPEGNGTEALQWVYRARLFPCSLHGRGFNREL